MTGRRCPLHGASLRAGRRRRVPATALSGRKALFHAAERQRFPHAGAFLFCRTGNLDAEYCPVCRAALTAWLADPQQALLRAALLGAVPHAAEPRP